jgi:uracil-DNA glycosylase family protein
MATAGLPREAKMPARRISVRRVEPVLDGDSVSIANLREAAKGCRRCPLWWDSTQNVLGEGHDHANLVFVGEQPGDQEDLAGKPFVGPAGKVFDAILDDAGVGRQKVYVTNAVKHFKFEPRGKRRIHSSRMPVKSRPAAGGSAGSLT